MVEHRILYLAGARATLTLNLQGCSLGASHQLWFGCTDIIRMMTTAPLMGLSEIGLRRLYVKISGNYVMFGLSEAEGYLPPSPRCVKPPS